jgi:hypothetical protein
VIVLLFGVETAIGFFPKDTFALSLQTQHKILEVIACRTIIGGEQERKHLFGQPLVQVQHTILQVSKRLIEYRPARFAFMEK